MGKYPYPAMNTMTHAGLSMPSLIRGATSYV